MGLIGTTPEVGSERAGEPLRFGPKTPMSEKLLAIAIRAQNFTGSTGVAIALTEGSELVCRANWGTSAPDVGVRLSLSEKSFTGQCVRSAQPLRCDDSETDPRVDAAACRALGVRAIVVAPVRQGAKVAGVIAAFSDTPRAFTEKHVLILTTLAEVIAGYFEEGSAGALADAASSDSQPDAPPPSPKVPSEPAAAAPAQAAEKPAAKTAADSGEEAKSAVPSTVTTFFPQGQRAGAAPAPDPAAAAHAPRRGGELRENVLVPAMDPLPAGARPKAKIAAITQAPVSAPAFQKMPLESLGGADYEQDWERRRKLVLGAAAVALVAVLGVAGWKLTHRAPQAVVPPPVAAAPAAEPEPQPQATSSAPLAQVPVVQANAQPQTIVVEDRTRIVSGGAAASKVQAAKLNVAGNAPASKAAPADPVVAAPAGQIRQPTAAQGPASAPQEEQAPQLALASPPVPSVLTKAPVAPPPLVSGQASAPQLVHSVPPQYPAIARQFQMSGTVVLRAKVTREGTIAELQFVRGESIFRDAAIAAVKQWRYQPAQLGGQAIESTTEIVITFKPPAR